MKPITKREVAASMRAMNNAQRSIAVLLRRNEAAIENKQGAILLPDAIARLGHAKKTLSDVSLACAVAYEKLKAEKF